LLVPRLEKSIGIKVYATNSLGVGGVIRQCPEDFVVREVLVDGCEAAVTLSERNAEQRALGCSDVKNRYVLCVLVKRNWDTFLALDIVAKQLGISTKRIQIAGIKDAKALTAQHITIEDVSAEEVRKVQAQDMKIDPIGYFRSKLSSYYLLGNHFHITVRAITLKKSKIGERIAKIVEELRVIGGAPNFFGHQRFGTIRSITHLVGKAIIQQDFEKAAMLFLAEPSLYEHPESRWGREQLQKAQDFKWALNNFPKQLHYERLMLKHLAKKPDDFVNAFRRLPTKLRRLFPQAFQAYLFNKFLSERIEKELGLNRAQVGDYVVNTERSGLPMLRMHRTASMETVTDTNKAIQAGKMQLAIPLIGFKQHPSQGLQGEIEERILQEEDIAMENFKIGSMPEASLRGGLRTAVVSPNDFSIEAISDDHTNPSKYEAELSFMLHRGSYATIILRELMKPRNPIKAGF